LRVSRVEFPGKKKILWFSKLKFRSSTF
jgi:hypothetical protein